MHCVLRSDVHARIRFQNNHRCSTGTKPFFSIPVFQILSKKGEQHHMSGTLVASGLSKIGRPELAQIAVPEATSTHKPVPHHTIVEALVETLSFRHIGVVQEEYAVSPDGAKMFGVLDLETQMEGCRLNADSPIMPTTTLTLRLGGARLAS